jgi:uncharacterized membrane protein YhaH (DUF805 family)
MRSFFGAIEDFFNRAFDFQGRSSRSQFWWAQLFMLIVAVVGISMLFLAIVNFGGASTGHASIDNGSVYINVEGAVYNSKLTDVNGIARIAARLLLGPGFWLVIAILLVLTLLIPMLSVFVRRLRDVGLSSVAIVIILLNGFVFSNVDDPSTPGRVLYIITQLIGITSFIITVLKSDAIVLNTNNHSTFSKIFLRVKN